MSGLPSGYPPRPLNLAASRGREGRAAFYRQARRMLLTRARHTPPVAADGVCRPGKPLESLVLEARKQEPL